MAGAEDRGSAIRVERLTTIPVGAKGYVKLETNMGVTGWGEINNMSPARWPNHWGNWSSARIRPASSICGSGCSAPTAICAAAVL